MTMVRWLGGSCDNGVGEIGVCGRIIRSLLPMTGCWGHTGIIELCCPFPLM